MISNQLGFETASWFCCRNLSGRQHSTWKTFSKKTSHRSHKGSLMSEAPLTSPHVFLGHASDDLLSREGAEVPRVNENLNFWICAVRVPTIRRHLSDLDCDGKSVGFGNCGVISNTVSVAGFLLCWIGSGADINFWCWYLKAAWRPGVSDGNAGIKNTKGGHIWPMKPVMFKDSDDVIFEVITAMSRLPDTILPRALAFLGWNPNDHGGFGRGFRLLQGYGLSKVVSLKASYPDDDLVILTCTFHTTFS